MSQLYGRLDKAMAPIGKVEAARDACHGQGGEGRRDARPIRRRGARGDRALERRALTKLQRLAGVSARAAGGEGRRCEALSCRSRRRADDAQRRSFARLIPNCATPAPSAKCLWSQYSTRRPNCWGIATVQISDLAYTTAALHGLNKVLRGFGSSVHPDMPLRGNLGRLNPPAIARAVDHRTEFDSKCRASGWRRTVQQRYRGRRDT